MWPGPWMIHKNYFCVPKFQHTKSVSWTIQNIRRKAPDWVQIILNAALHCEPWYHICHIFPFQPSNYFNKHVHKNSFWHILIYRPNNKLLTFFINTDSKETKSRTQQYHSENRISIFVFLILQIRSMNIKIIQKHYYIFLFRDKSVFTPIIWIFFKYRWNRRTALLVNHLILIFMLQNRKSYRST